ncbi:tRNA pseudouridine(13) synthase TruD [Thalassotalea sp. SU-HH00458]|uniref:tRNA pseudouridine(13) synthase TruD n=1 Tax=Thalassotalea sp. SU-HH00458 TaxID=3127657 RepID=UPI0031083DA6
MLPTFDYLYGKPTVTGDLRSSENDFKVFEQLPFSPCGEGEHLFIHLRKTGQNTGFVAKQLAKYFSVKENLVSYAGLKDRFAVTEQWFGIHLPGKQAYDLSDLSIDGVEIIDYARHNKKLRIGSLSGNRFEITLRNVSDINELQRRWHAVTAFGVPNYFGEQRFGIDGGNIERAIALFAGQKVKDKKKRGMYLSAARSLLFNHIIAKRIENNTFDKLQTGDVLMLAGSQSVFLLEAIDDIIEQRFIEKDVDITAPLWGTGQLMTSGNPYTLEESLLESHADFCHGLAKFGLKQERRRIRLLAKDGAITTNEAEKCVTVTFTLAAGCFATTILRELLVYKDLTARVGSRIG